MSGSSFAAASSRGAVPAVGLALLIVCTVVLAGAVGGVALQRVPEEPPPTASLSLSVDNERITLGHRGGDPLDVRDLRIRVTVGGTPLSEQPPVPFFSAAGFRPGPTGPFNSAADPEWSVGESAGFRVAETNAPAPSAGAVAVTVYADGRPIAQLRA